MAFTVHKGKHYKASFKLGFLESAASNDLIKEKLENAGFEDVKVWGEGGVRYASGTWPHDDVEASLPSQLHEIIEVA